MRSTIRGVDPLEPGDLDFIDLRRVAPGDLDLPAQAA
jgi:hypothetical protein